MFYDGNSVECQNLPCVFLFCPLVLIFYLICLFLSLNIFIFSLFHYMYFLKAGLKSSVGQSEEHTLTSPFTKVCLEKSTAA